MDDWPPDGGDPRGVGAFVAAAELANCGAGSPTGRRVEGLHQSHSVSKRFRACSERAWVRWSRRCWRLCCRCLLAACHVSFQRRLQTALRSASMRLTLCRSQRMPAPYATCFHHHLVGTFDTPRANGPVGCLIGGVLHVRLALVQISQFLLDSWTGIARDQPAQVLEYALWSLMF